MLHIEPETFIPFLIFAIPIIAIVGGITAGIVRTMGNQRLMEMAQRERIVAIERGIDPSKLPPLPVAVTDRSGLGDMMFISPYEYAKRRYQGLMIGGLVCLFVGAGLSVFLWLVNGGEARGAWAVGLIPGGVGAALLLSAMIVKPHDNGSASPPAPPLVR
jgi:hypothetical protein